MDFETIDSEIMLQNEKESNKFVSFSMFFCALINVILSFFYIFCSDTHAIGVTEYLFPIMFVVIIIPAIISSSVNYEGKWIKYLLFFTIILSSSAIDLAFSYYGLLAMCIPLLLSIRYANWKFTLVISIVTLFGYLFSSIFSFYLLRTNEAFYKLYTYYLYFYSWNDISSHLLTHFFFKFIIFLLLAYMAVNLSANCKFLIRKNIKNIKENLSNDTQLQLAGKLQSFSIPKEREYESDAIDICATITPAKETAGDFYDFCFIDEDTFAVLIGDVSDKGLSAAMEMMSIKNSLHAYMVATKDLEKTISYVNKAFCDGNEICMFVTLWVAFINIKSGHVRYINAGHLPPYIKYADGRISQIKNDPLPFLGIDPDFEYKEESFILEKDETLLLYTDGVTDAENVLKTRFSDKRLKNTLSLEFLSVKDLCHNINSNICRFIGDLSFFDDTTVVALQMKLNNRFLTLPANQSSATSFIDWINSFCVAYNVDETTANLISSSIDEIITNIVDYAYVDMEENQKENNITLEVNPSEEEIEIKIIDTGFPFNPLELGAPDLDDTDRIGGLGIFLVNNIMDKVDYCRCDNKNMLTVTKKWK